MLSLPQIEESKKKKIPCSEFLKTTVPVGINMKDWGILINKYGHTTSTRAHKWEERSRERMYMCVYFGWATKRVVEKRDAVFLTPEGRDLLLRYNELRELIFKDFKLSNKEEECIGGNHLLHLYRHDNSETITILINTLS